MAEFPTFPRPSVGDYHKSADKTWQCLVVGNPNLPDGVAGARADIWDLVPVPLEIFEDSVGGDGRPYDMNPVSVEEEVTDLNTGQRNIKYVFDIKKLKPIADV